MKPLTVSISQTCQLTGLGRTSVYARLHEGELTASKIGRRTLVSIESIETMLKKEQFKDLAAVERVDD